MYRLGLGPWEVSATHMMRIGLSALFHTHTAHPRGTARASPLLRRLAGSKKCMRGKKIKDEGEFSASRFLLASLCPATCGDTARALPLLRDGMSKDQDA